MTNDNLIKHNWKGCTKCCFCSAEESIQHLFFDCHVARLVWNIISIAFGIQTPSSVSNMLGPWRRSFPRKQRKTILIGVTALCWAIWPVGMMSSLKAPLLSPLCRQFSGGLIRPRAGQYYLKMKRGST